MKRRSFLRQSLYASAAVPFSQLGFSFSTSERPAFLNSLANEDNILVLLKMNGGNDGLNTLIPLDKYGALFNARPTVIIPEDSILKLSEEKGLHPSMSGIQNLYFEGLTGFVDNVGYPNQNRSHFRGMDIIQTGSNAQDVWTTGWLGRYFDERYPSYPEGYPNEEYPDPFGITLGNGVTETCQGLVSNYSISMIELGASLEEDGAAPPLPDTPYGDELGYIRTIIEQSNAYSSVITEANEKGTNTIGYPVGNGLGRSLAQVARLISGGLKTRIYTVSIGGFDTHANQVEKGDTTKGTHANLLQRISEAVTAFLTDIRNQGLEQKVLGMTYSEFGRQIKANDSLGTDHGTAAPVMFFGQPACMGVVGESAIIPEEVERQAGVAMQIDFRDVYGSVLIDWLGADEAEIQNSFQHGFTYLPLINNCNAVVNTREILNPSLKSKAFPNPFRNWTQIEFEQENSGRVRISILDSVGKEVTVLSDQRFNAGTHTVRFEGRNLAPGNYYYRIQLENGGQKTFHIVKQ